MKNPFEIMESLLYLKDILHAIAIWECPNTFQMAICPYPHMRMVGVILCYRDVYCEVPIGCPCCVNRNLDATVGSLIQQADADPYEDGLSEAARRFQMAIEEIRP